MQRSTKLGRLLAGKPLKNVEFHKTVVVSGKTLTNPFECTHCTFDGGLLARDTDFKRTVNLSGSTFDGSVVMAGATFEGPVVFIFVLPPAVPTQQNTMFNGTVDFTLATFKDSADFDLSSFLGPATFQLARFGSEADFDGASFFADATFDSARFSTVTNFRAATFLSLASFNYASGPSTDFTYATFSSMARFTFFRAAGGTLSFENATFASSPASLDLEQIVATDLVLDPAAATHVGTAARDPVLALIESTAKARGDLGVANDAYYRIREQRGSTWGPVGQVLDVVFYRWVAGYLVVPWRPLIALVLLALLVALWRSRRTPPPAPTERDAIAIGPPTPHRGRRLVPARLSRWGHELLDALFLVVPRPGGAAAGRRFESFVYRLLFVCMLFGFANSNPTLRQMLDAVL